MGTTSNRSAGTQVTKNGITQGNVLVDPITGFPVAVIRDNAGVRRLAVDANLTVDDIIVDTRELTPTTDQVGIGDKVSGYFLKINPDGSVDTNVNIQASSDNIAIRDETSGNKLKINADGSINATTSASAGATTPTIFNLVVPAANTEVSQALPTDTRKFLIKVRDDLGAKMQLAFGSGQSGTTFITVGRGAIYVEDNVVLSSVTLYFQLDRAGKTVEILAWN
jgi:hypothetical protein